MTEEKENLDAALAGQVMSVWMPIGFLRRVIFFVLIFFGTMGILKTSEWYHWAMLIFAATMSPRLVGEALYAVGRLSALLSKK
jgi:hypothetical protein